jgi:hypothetical protein
MINHKTIRQIAAYGVSLPTFAASPSVAKATVYMPSHVAAELLRLPPGAIEQRNGCTIGSEQDAKQNSAA